MGFILLIVLIVLLLGGLPRWGYSRNWGYTPSGFLSLLLLIVAGVVGLGFYMGWFHFSSGSDDKNAHVTVSVDKVATTSQKARD